MLEIPTYPIQFSEISLFFCIHVTRPSQITWTVSASNQRSCIPLEPEAIMDQAFSSISHSYYYRKMAAVLDQAKGYLTNIDRVCEP